MDKGSRLRSVGFEDTIHTLETLTRALNPKVMIRQDLLESALWSCNLLDEQKGFWHPKGENFDSFKKTLERTDKFNRKYNYFE